MPDLPLHRTWPTGGGDWDIGELESWSTAAEFVELEQRHGNYTNDATDLLATARREGLLDARWPATPEEGLLRIHASWAEAEHTWAARLRAHGAEHLPPGEELHTLSDAERAALWRDHPFPGLDPETMREVAEDVRTAFPEHAVADHALFALVRAELPSRAGELLGPQVVDLTERIRDPIVREEAMLLVTRVHRIFDVEPVVLDAALQQAASASPANALRLSSWAVSMASHQGDWEQAAEAAEVMRTLVGTHCSDALPDDHLLCDRRVYDLRDAVGRLAALDLLEPSTWREAVTAATWRCHIEGRQHEGTATGALIWKGGWAEETWQSPSELTRCAVAQELAVTPPDGTRVRWVVEAGGSAGNGE